MFNLQLLHGKAVSKFSHQVPMFNWHYPFYTSKDLFHDGLLPLILRNEAATARRSIYIHIPFCQTICNFCPFRKDALSSDESIESYVNALLEEIRLKRAFLGPVRIDALTIGGGTPSLLAPDQIVSIGNALRHNFDLSSLKEFTVEVEAKSAIRSKLLAMKEIGVNRISFGAQTFSDRYRSMLSLDATINSIVATADLINSLFDYTNVDILYGFAGQSLSELHRDIEMAVALDTATIDFYPINNLTAPNAMHSAIARAKLPYLSASTRHKYRTEIINVMKSQNYAPISGYSFSKRRPPLKGPVQHAPKFLYHDMVYGYHDDEILGFGSSALSQIPGFNLYNIADRRKYVESLLGGGKLPHSAFAVGNCPERGIVTFPYRGELIKSRIPWSSVPDDTLVALQELVLEELVEDRGDTYALTESGLINYANMMYYLMPKQGKEWISAKINQLSSKGRLCGDTSLDPSQAPIFSSPNDVTMGRLDDSQVMFPRQ